MRYILGFKSPELFTINREVFSTDSETHVYILNDFNDLIKTIELSLIPRINKGDFIALYDMFPSAFKSLTEDISVIEQLGAKIKSYTDWVQAYPYTLPEHKHGAVDEMVADLEVAGMDANLTYSIIQRLNDVKHSLSKQEMASYLGLSLPTFKDNQLAMAEQLVSNISASNTVFAKRLFENLPKYHTTFGNVVVNKNGKQSIAIERIAKQNIFSSISVFLAGNGLGVSIVSPNEQVNLEIADKFFDDSYFHKGNRSLSFIHATISALDKSISQLLESEIIPDEARQEKP